MAAPEVQPAIICRDVHKRFATIAHEQVDALTGIDLTVSEGEFVCVVGPSGCGKSTLLRLIAGTLQRSSGDILVRGTPVDGPRRDIGIVFQTATLLPWRNVLANTLLPVDVQGLDKKVYTERARALLQMVGLEGFERKYPSELSGGMQQRVSITRALVHDPAVLLMDEPFGALDEMTREHMQAELLRICAGTDTTVVFVTHSIPEAVYLADRVVVMSPRPGRITDIIDVSLGRDRDELTREASAFFERVTEVREALRGIEMSDHARGIEDR
jgi:NitT/TauT family transport system ATP-binding protein